MKSTLRWKPHGRKADLQAGLGTFTGLASNGLDLSLTSCKTVASECSTTTSPPENIRQGVADSRTPGARAGSVRARACRRLFGSIAARDRLRHARADGRKGYITSQQQAAPAATGGLPSHVSRAYAAWQTAVRSVDTRSAPARAAVCAMKTHPRWIRAVAARLCDSTTIERLIDPILTDIELEHRWPRRIWAFLAGALDSFDWLRGASRGARLTRCARVLPRSERRRSSGTNPGILCRSLRRLDRRPGAPATAGRRAAPSTVGPRDVRTLSRSAGASVEHSRCIGVRHRLRLVS